MLFSQSFTFSQPKGIVHPKLLSLFTQSHIPYLIQRSLFCRSLFSIQLQWVLNIFKKHVKEPLSAIFKVFYGHMIALCEEQREI